MPAGTSLVVAGGDGPPEDATIATRFHLRSSRDGRTWSSSLAIWLRDPDDGRWCNATSGGTSFGAPEGGRARSSPVRGAWTWGGDTVSVEREAAEGHFETVMAVSGFAAADVEAIVVDDGSAPRRRIQPQPDLGAYAAVAVATSLTLTPVIAGRERPERSVVLGIRP